MRSSRATAEAMLLDCHGSPITQLEIEYHIIPEANFRSLFEVHAQRTFEQSANNPYLSCRPLPEVTFNDGTWEVRLGPVDARSCLGHFAGYPALPVSIMTRDAVRLVAEAIRSQTGWTKAQITVSAGGVTAHRFAFANDNICMSARRTRYGNEPLCEHWHCEAKGNSVRFADFEFLVHIRPNVANRRWRANTTIPAKSA